MLGSPTVWEMLLKEGGSPFLPLLGGLQVWAPVDT